MEQTQIHFDLSPAERVAYDACGWIRDHREAFRKLMAYFHSQVDAGNPRTTRDDAMAWCRENAINMSVLDEIARDHSLYACISRFAVMLRPRLARTIRFRKSQLDDIDLAQAWHETVDSRTTFLAKSRKEAEHLVEIGDVSAL